jgi:hypothetical protein
MAKQVINTTDSLNAGRTKINDNFTELYDRTDMAESTTIIPLTNSDLNTAFPSAPNGFRVVAPLIVGGSVIYIKISTGWVSTTITVL